MFYDIHDHNTAFQNTTLELPKEILGLAKPLVLYYALNSLWGGFWQLMPYQVEYPWRKNPRLLAVTLFDEVSAEDVVFALETTLSLLEKSLLPMHTVIDCSDAASLPSNLMPLVLESGLIQHPNQGYWVLVNPPPLGEELADFLHRDMGVSVARAASLDGAWDVFNQMGIC